MSCTNNHNNLYCYIKADIINRSYAHKILSSCSIKHIFHACFFYPSLEIMCWCHQQLLELFFTIRENIYRDYKCSFNFLNVQEQSFKVLQYQIFTKKMLINL